MKKREKWRQWWKERDKQTLVLVRYSQERGGKVKYFKRHLIRRKQRRIGRKWWIKREWMDEKLHYQILLHVRKIWQLSVWVCGECVWGMCVSVWGMCADLMQICFARKHMLGAYTVQSLCWTNLWTWQQPNGLL